MNKNTTGRHLKLAAWTLTAALLPALGGCDDKPEAPAQPTQETRTDQPKPADNSTGNTGEFLPYSIRFDEKAQPVIVDDKGEVVVMKEVEPPFKATEIKGVQAISVVTYKGSCKQIYNIGGKLYEITLPDAYCKKL